MEARNWWGADLLERGRADSVWATAGTDRSSGRLRDQVARLSTTLESHGIRSGHTVAVQCAPSFTQCWCILALLSLGAQVVLTDARMDRFERAALFRVCAPQFLVTFGGQGPRPDAFVAECEVLVQRRLDGVGARTSHCLVQFSSGTTGRAKIVGRSPESLLIELERLRMVDGMPGAGERVAMLSPMAHSFGFVVGLLHTLDAGATAVFPTASTRRAIAQATSLADVVLGTPRHMAALAAAVDVPSGRLRMAVSAGDMVTDDVARAFRHRYGVRVGQAYGTTETGVVATDLAGVYGPPYIGLPVPGVRTRVVGGVLLVHVAQSPYPYERQPWPGGWMSTEDLVDQEPGGGALRYRGRAGASGFRRTLPRFVTA